MALRKDTVTTSIINIFRNENPCIHAPFPNKTDILMCHSHCTKTNRVFRTPRFCHSFHFSIPFFLSSLFLSLFYFLEKSATSRFCYRKSHFQRPVPNSSTETSHTSLITIYNYVYPASSFSAASLIWYCVYLERKNYYFFTLT